MSVQCMLLIVMSAVIKYTMLNHQATIAIGIVY